MTLQKASQSSCSKLSSSRSKPLSITLIHTPCYGVNDDRLEPPLGLLYLATVARQRGYRARVVDLSSVSEEDLESRIPTGCNVYGFSTYTVTYELTRRLANALREREPRAFLLAGGPHTTALPVEVASDGFDTVVTGEGEIVLPEVLDTISRGERPPAVVTGRSPEPLDNLPFPDYALVDLTQYSRQVFGERCVSVLSSRGCPYSCVFCNSNILGAGKPIRFRSPENVDLEIRRIKKRYGIRTIRFQDDTFAISERRVASLASTLSRAEIHYRCFARVNTFSRRMARLLRESGCVHVSFGVESGSPKMLSRHKMNKGQTPDQIRRALENAHAEGIRTRIFLMVGFPGETSETIGETLGLLRSCPWEEFSAYPCIAYPGTPLHDTPERFGITHINRDYRQYYQVGRNRFAGFTIQTKEFDEDDVKRWRDQVISTLIADGRSWAGESIGFQ